MRRPGETPSIYKGMPTDEQRVGLVEALDALRKDCALGLTISIVDLPFWYPAAEAMRSNILIYDCMDYHPGFLNNEPAMLSAEDKLIKSADLVVTTSASLHELVGAMRANTLIRNGCEVEHFLFNAGCPVKRLSERPVVGYFGAIDHWFDVDLLSKSARAYPAWDFILIGSAHGCDTRRVRQLSNVKFLGEIPYADLAQYLFGFDICTIPFLINELTRHTNPVKMYEYMAAGRPVVATSMPEVCVAGKGLVYVGKDHEEYVAKLALAMEQHKDARLVGERVAFARSNSWGTRVRQLEDAIKRLLPKVSVIVLVYNNIELTRRCLESLERYSYYPNLELIVIDNASPDRAVHPYLLEFAAAKTWVKVIRNSENRGFAGGNNVGLRESAGEYFVLLNNDTRVSPGWVWDLLRHLRRDPSIGLIGPVTNSIGNEARIEINYKSEEEMLEASRRYVEAKRGNRLYVDTIAFSAPCSLGKSLSALALSMRNSGLECLRTMITVVVRVLQATRWLLLTTCSCIMSCLAVLMLSVRSKAATVRGEQTPVREQWGPWTPQIPIGCVIMSGAGLGSRPIVCVVGTRPEAIKMAPVILKLREQSWAPVRVLATAQHRELADEVFDLLGIAPDIDLDLMQPNQTLAGLTARALMGLDDALTGLDPRMLLAQGDTTSVLAAAMVCFYRGIPFLHVEAGLRSFDLQNPFPEEFNRIVGSRVAAIHFAPTHTARKHLLDEGVRHDTIVVTGNTVIDALLMVAARDLPLPIAIDPAQRLLLVTVHRRENFGDPIRDICDAIRILVDQYDDVSVLWPVHPNPNVGEVVRDLLGLHPRIHLVGPLAYTEFIAAMKRSYFILSDSGGVQEEGPALGRPVLVLRRQTERPEAIEFGVVRLVGTERDGVLEHARELLNDPAVYKRMARGISPYGDGHASERIAATIQRRFFPNARAAPDIIGGEFRLGDIRE